MNTKSTMISCAIIASMTGAAHAAITVDWYTTAAPNVFGAASYAQFWDDATQSIITMGGVDNGSFTNMSEVTGMQSYVTTFQSLDGVFEASEYGSRPTWIYYISNDDGSLMDNSMLGTATKNYGNTWEGTYESFWGDIPFGDFNNGRLGVRADGTTSTDINGDYVGFIASSGNAWTPWNWSGTLGVDHAWTTAIDASDPDRFTKLAQLAEYTGIAQDSWNFSINFGGTDFFAPDINVVPAPGAAALLVLGGLVVTRRRR